MVCDEEGGEVTGGETSYVLSSISILSGEVCIRGQSLPGDRIPHKWVPLCLSLSLLIVRPPTCTPNTPTFFSPPSLDVLLEEATIQAHTHPPT